MRILIIYNRFQFAGGDETYVMSIIRLFKKNGHKVILYTKDSGDIKPGFFNSFVIFLKLFWNKQVEVELSEIIEKNKPDIAYIQNIFPLINPTVYKICKKYDLSIVQRIHDYRLTCMKLFLYRDNKVCLDCLGKKFFYPGILHKCYRRSLLASVAMALAFWYYNFFHSFDPIDLYIFPSKFVRNIYAEKKIVLKRKTVVLPTMFHEEKRIKKERKVKNKYFMFAGRFAEEKGIYTLLEAFKSLSKIELRLVGWGPLSETVKRYTKYKNIKVYSKVSRKKVVAFMQKALATIIPSVSYDILPNVLIESFAAGTPVIVPKHGPFVDLVNEGKTGFFFQAGNISSLKTVVNTVYSKKNILQRLESNIKQEFDHKYQQKVHYQKLIKILSVLTSKR